MIVVTKIVQIPALESTLLLSGQLLFLVARTFQTDQRNWFNISSSNSSSVTYFGCETLIIYSNDHSTTIALRISLVGTEQYRSHGCRNTFPNGAESARSFVSDYPTVSYDFSEGFGRSLFTAYPLVTPIHPCLENTRYTGGFWKFQSPATCLGSGNQNPQSGSYVHWETVGVCLYYQLTRLIVHWPSGCGHQQPL